MTLDSTVKTTVSKNYFALYYEFDVEILQKNKINIVFNVQHLFLHFYVNQVIVWTHSTNLMITCLLNFCTSTWLHGWDWRDGWILVSPAVWSSVLLPEVWHLSLMKSSFLFSFLLPLPCSQHTRVFNHLHTSVLRCCSQWISNCRM